MHRQFFMTLFFLFATSLFAADVEMEKEKVKAVIFTAQEHWNNRDMKKFSEAYLETAEFTDIFGNVYNGREAIASRKVKLHENSEAHLVIDSITVSWLFGTNATTVTTWHIENTDPVVKGVWLQFLVKLRNEWLISKAENKKI